ncbi:hypothetical protein CVT25_012371 [Psilocybe cyanescens]|uniref:SET domain-containing protein n=1 Tax=Psilocybe cyanescens TaxID=93625 RepID=A0A409XC38_PSICY|nr:hypothetical protein CVT25_012371 [Psilocybe cyanescens]
MSAEQRTSAEEVKHVYESVWNEYSTWSQQYNQNALESLSRPYSHRRFPPLKKKKTRKSRFANAKASSSASSHRCTIVDFDDEEEIEQSTIALQPTVIDTDQFTPYPPYDSCTSVSQNLLVGDDSHYMPFVPFSDDPSYNFSDDLELHHYTAWQKHSIDTDEQHITLETVRRLVKECGLLYETIDATRILPMQCHDIIRLLRQRDFPKWLPNTSTSDLPQITAPDTPSAAVDYFLEYFCSNLNCLTGFCSLHDGESVRQQVPKSLPPKIPYTKPSDAVDAPCGAYCFLQPPTYSTLGTSWTKEDHEVLDLTLRYAPDTTPCDLSIICRKPCREIYRYQYAHPRTVPRPPKTRQPSQLKTRTYDDERPSRFTPNVGVQKGAIRATEVRESQWGLGLFLAETAEEGDLISEYVGEMIRPLTVDSRNFHAEHRERSYVFHLNPTYALDSAYAGNNTRYMNHSAEASNCHTRVVLVNGEHRIGVYAARRIEKGEELLINYGTYFWTSDKQTQLETSLPVQPAYDDPKDLTYKDLDSSY